MSFRIDILGPTGQELGKLPGAGRKDTDRARAVPVF
jgi:hypothetical protein